MEHDELKPCPFCGGEAEKVLIGNNHTKSRKVVIKCTKCFTEQRTATIRHDHDWCDKIATKKWNERFVLKPVEIPEITDGIFDLKTFQTEQKEWSDKNFPVTGNHNYRPLLGAMEELGELSHAHLKAEQGIRTNENHQEAKKDAIGDIIIYLSDYCNKEGLSLGECINDTWKQVKQRDWTKNKINGQ